MRYSLLDELRCPACLTPLLCVTTSEITSAGSTGTDLGWHSSQHWAWHRTSAGVVDVKRIHADTANTRRIPAPAARGNEVEVESGLLLCACERWFPIERGIPELLPDHLRETAKDFSRLDAVTAVLPSELVSIAATRAARGARLGPTSARITSVPKSTSRAKSTARRSSNRATAHPLPSGIRAFSVYLLKLFGAVAPLLALTQGERVIDSGCGYAWTTEWLLRSGFDPIGVDICRTYLEVGLTRMGASRPHLVIADVENLPFAPGIARAVLAYESFHHIPDRARALRAYERVLQDGGVAILAEPGAAHEQAQVAIDAMQKYGILEKGMELVDVAVLRARHDARRRAALPDADGPRRSRRERQRSIREDAFGSRR